MSSTSSLNSPDSGAGFAQLTTTCLIWALRMLCNQLFVPQYKFLVYGSGEVSKHAQSILDCCAAQQLIETNLNLSGWGE